MVVELTYQEMSYLRSLLHKDNPHKLGLDEKIRRSLLAKLLKLENDYAAGLIA